ncbi:MAG: glycosyltransferase [Pseudomonadota bacterium]
MDNNKKDKEHGKIFISWNDSGRTRDLSDALRVPAFVKQIGGQAWYRHTASSFWTVWLLAIKRPRTILFQNSFLLALVLGMYRSIRGKSVVLIADCHTKSLKRALPGRLGYIFWRLKFWSLTRCQALIIATPELLPEANKFGRQVLVFPDIVPDWAPESQAPVERNKFLVVGSFAEDEPIEEMISAFENLPECSFAMTGTPSPKVNNRDLPPNVTLLGFVADNEFKHRLATAGGVIALTKDTDCFLRSVCEALATSRPIVTSDTPALRQYLDDAAVFVNPNCESIAAGVARANNMLDELQSRSEKRRREIKQTQEQRLEELRWLLATNQTTR